MENMGCGEGSAHFVPQSLPSTIVKWKRCWRNISITLKNPARGILSGRPDYIN